jgi:hypothetical protein
VSWNVRVVAWQPVGPFGPSRVSRQGGDRDPRICTCDIYVPIVLFASYASDKPGPHAYSQARGKLQSSCTCFEVTEIVASPWFAKPPETLRLRARPMRQRASPGS